MAYNPQIDYTPQTIQEVGAMQKSADTLNTENYDATVAARIRAQALADRAHQEELAGRLSPANIGSAVGAVGGAIAGIPGGPAGMLAGASTGAQIGGGLGGMVTPASQGGGTPASVAGAVSEFQGGVNQIPGMPGYVDPRASALLQHGLIMTNDYGPINQTVTTPEHLQAPSPKRLEGPGLPVNGQESIYPTSQTQGPSNLVPSSTAPMAPPKPSNPSNFVIPFNGHYVEVAKSPIYDYRQNSLGIPVAAGTEGAVQMANGQYILPKSVAAQSYRNSQDNSAPDQRTVFKNGKNMIQQWDTDNKQWTDTGVQGAQGNQAKPPKTTSAGLAGLISYIGGISPQSALAQQQRIFNAPYYKALSPADQVSFFNAWKQYVTPYLKPQRGGRAPLYAIPEPTQ